MMVMFLQKEALGKLTRSIISSFCSKPTNDKGYFVFVFYAIGIEVPLLL
jgi:hypothetical protein